MENCYATIHLHTSNTVFIKKRSKNEASTAARGAHPLGDESFFLLLILLPFLLVPHTFSLHLLNQRLLGHALEPHWVKSLEKKYKKMHKALVTSLCSLALVLQIACKAAAGHPSQLSRHPSISLPNICAGKKQTHEKKQFRKLKGTKQILNFLSGRLGRLNMTHLHLQSQPTSLLLR